MRTFMDWSRVGDVIGQRQRQRDVRRRLAELAAASERRQQYRLHRTEHDESTCEYCQPVPTHGKAW